MTTPPSPVVQGTPLVPTNLRRGPGRVVVGESAVNRDITVLMVSQLDGEDWQVLPIPGG